MKILLYSLLSAAQKGGCVKDEAADPNSNVTMPVPAPTKFTKAGYYPMSYSIKQVGDDVVVGLDGLMLMQ